MFREPAKNLKDYNLFFGVDPHIKGVGIEASYPPQVYLSPAGRIARRLSQTGEITARLPDPFYFGQDVWMAHVVIGGLRESGTYALGETVTLWVANTEDHVIGLRPDADMVYKWTNTQGEELYGQSISFSITDNIEYWTVVGISALYGNTVATTFTLLSDTTVLPIPRIQTLTNYAGRFSPYKVLNSEYYDTETAVLEWRRLGETTTAYTTDSDFFQHTFGETLGITYWEVRIVAATGETTPWTAIPEIVTDSPTTVINNYALFTPVNPVTRAPLSNSLATNGPGTRTYFQMNPYSGSINSGTDSIEVEVLSVRNAILRNPGIFRAEELVEVEILPFTEPYLIEITYHYRKKGTTGGTVHTFKYTVADPFNELYKFDVELPKLLPANATGTFYVDDSKCLPLGAYTFTLNATGVAMLGLSGDENTRRPVGKDQPLAYTIQPNNTQVDLTFTWWNIINEIVRVDVISGFQVTTGRTDIAYYDSPTDTGLWVDRTSTGPVDMVYTTRAPGSTNRLIINPAHTVAYDLFNISIPERLVKEVPGFEFTGSSEYPEEYYRETEIDNLINDDLNPLDYIDDLRRFDFRLTQNGESVTTFSGRVSSNGVTHEVLHQYVTNAEVAGGLVLFDGSQYHTVGTPYESLQLLIINTIGSNTASNYRAYVVGPNLELLVIVKLEMGPEVLGKTTIAYTVEGEDHFIQLDPDTNQDDRDVFEVLSFDSLDSCTVKSLSLGATFRLTTA
jgi:hypothetical protein